MIFQSQNLYIICVYIYICISYSEFPSQPRCQRVGFSIPWQSRQLLLKCAIQILSKSHETIPLKTMNNRLLITIHHQHSVSIIHHHLTTTNNHQPSFNRHLIQPIIKSPVRWVFRPLGSCGAKGAQPKGCGTGATILLIRMEHVFLHLYIPYMCVYIHEFCVYMYLCTWMCR